ncbi:MAG: hypothetical protein C0478_04710 [Planctomyces sp.]|nr:hypothetical protein [Planctomyces sp.]
MMLASLPRFVALMSLLAIAALTNFATTCQAAEEPQFLVDQFGEKHAIGAAGNGVTILVYGDRKAMKASKELGSQLHLAFHPTAAGLPPAEGAKAPVRPVAGAQGPSPEVFVIPVALMGDKIPEPIRPVIIKQFKKGSPDFPVWLDFENLLKSQYGAAEGATQVLVFDRDSQLRWQGTCTLEEAQVNQLLRRIEALRVEQLRAGR